MGNFLACHDRGLEMATLVSPGVTVTVRDGDGHPLVWIYGDMHPLLRTGKWKTSVGSSVAMKQMLMQQMFKWFDVGWYIWRGKWDVS